MLEGIESCAFFHIEFQPPRH